MLVRWCSQAVSAAARSQAEENLCCVVLSCSPETTRRRTPLPPQCTRPSQSAATARTHRLVCVFPAGIWFHSCSRASTSNPMHAGAVVTWRRVAPHPGHVQRRLQPQRTWAPMAMPCALRDSTMIDFTSSTVCTGQRARTVCRARHATAVGAQCRPQARPGPMAQALACACARVLRRRHPPASPLALAVAGCSSPPRLEAGS